MKTVIAILLVIFPWQIFGQRLADVVNTALEFNSQIKASRLRTQSAEQELIREQRSNWPVISVKAHYVHNTDVPEFNIPLPGFNGGVSLSPRDNYEAGLNIDYVVFSGFAQSQAEKVKTFDYSIAAVNEEQQAKEIAIKTIQAYRNAQFMQLSLDILNDTRLRNQVQMNKVKALLENGMAVELDTLSLSLNATTIIQQIIESHSVLENWNQILEILTGMKTEIAFAGDLPGNPVFNAFSAEEQSALRNLQFEKQRMKAFASISKASYYPKIWLNASLNYGRPGPDFIADEWNTYGKWMIGLQWDIWNGWSTEASVQTKEYMWQALLHTQGDLQNNLKLNYDKALRKFESLQKQKTVAQKAVKVAREKMNIVAISAEKGQLSASDFNEANLELSQAEIRHQQILIQLNLQAAEIDFQSGKPVKMWRL